MSKHFTRRDLIHAGCTIAGATLVPHFMDRAEARLHSSAAAAPQFPVSQRTVINLDYALASGEYIFIDNFLVFSGFGGSGSGWQFDGAEFTSGSIYFNSAKFDAATGMPKYNPVSGGTYSGAFGCPSPTDYGGAWIITGTGEGQIGVLTNANATNGAGAMGLTVTTDAAGTGGASGKHQAGTTSNVTVQSPAQFLVSDSGGNGWTIRISSTSSAINSPYLCGVKIFQTDPNGTGKFIGYNGRFQMYREGDKARLLAGFITRLPWAQNMANMNPSAIRAMNWVGGNGQYAPYDDHTVRFEQRQLPNIPGLINNLASPPYTSATSSGHATYTLASAAGMSVSMQHGEVVFCRVDTTSPYDGNFISPSLVTLANPGVATHTAHGRSTGDQLLWVVPVTDGNGNAYGMNGLDGVLAPITVIDADHYSIGVDTTLASPKSTVTFSGATVTDTGSNRQVNDPIVFTNSGGALPTGLTAGQQYYVLSSGLTANQYQFAATVGGSAITTSGGSGTQSAQVGWFGANNNLAVRGCQAVICGTLNVGGRGAFPFMGSNGSFSAFTFQQYVAGQYWTFYFDKNVGFRTAVNGSIVPGAWMSNPSGTGITQPYMGVPIEFAVTVVNEVNALYTTQGRTDLWLTCGGRAMLSLDPDSSDPSNWAIGATGVVLNGANGYAGLNSRCCLMLQGQNESWNPTNITSFLQRVGILRYNTFAANATSGPVSNGNTNTYAALRSCVMVQDVKRVFPNNPRIKFVMGIQAFAGSQTINDNPLIQGDVANTWHVAPMVLHDFMCGAPYLDLGDGTWDAANLNTNVTLWKGGSPTQKATARLAYIQGFITPTAYPAQTIAAYNTIADGYASMLASTYPGKIYIGYEGGCNQAWTLGGNTYNGPLTQDQADFLVDCFRGPEWAAVMVAFYNHTSANIAMPALYVTQGSPWSFIQGFFDNYDASGVEFGAYSNWWTAIGARNQALPN